LSRYQQLSNKEIALQMGISEKTVEKQMTIALKKLKEKLGPNNAFLFFFL
jgi:DNA-directed RNA polymerase specialized sigma24 family protein